MRRTGATPAELEALYRERFESFVRVATGITRDPETGRDAVQAAFVSAIRSRRSYRGSGTLDSWVWRIVVNEARRLRSDNETMTIDEIATAPTMNGHGRLDEPNSGVWRWVAALPERQREAVFLRYFADLDYRTIARVLGLEPGTVSATLSAAHQTLRKRLEATQR